MRRWNVLVLVYVLALPAIPAPAAFAQTMGRIIGTVADASGAAMPGVTMSVTSPSLQGEQTAVTDAAGAYRFLSLPPGRYTVKAEMAGFKTVEQPNVEVGLDRTVEVNLELAVAGVAETVQVEATSPVIDTTSTALGITAKAELFNRLPIQRDIYSIARLAPGAIDDDVGTAVLGSTGAENQYIIEGLNTTGIERGEKGKVLNFDFVEEIDVKTGGLNAEYGRMTGGVINVITKSGGNTYRGSGFGFSEGGALQSDDNTADKRPQTTTTVADLDRKWDVGTEIGGFILKDRLWFFGAYNRQYEKIETEVIRDLVDAFGDPIVGAPARGAQIPAEVDRDLFAGKVTYRLGTGQTLVGSLNGDPSTRKGNLFAIAGPESTWQGTLDTGATDVAVRYDGVFGNDFLVRGLYGRHKENIQYAGLGKTIPLSLDQTVSPAIRTGGFGFHQDSEFTRNVYKADVTKFLGTHELKGGVDFEDILSSIDRYQGGAGQIVYRLRTAAGRIYYRHRFYVNDRASGYDRNRAATWQPAVPLTAEPGTENTSFYVQDSWKVLPNLSINGGVRWERQKIKDRDDETVIDLTDNWAPRIGFVWDFARNGRSKIFGNYGWFYESVPLDINIRAFGGEVICFCYNFDPNPANLIPDPAARASSLLGGPEPVDPGLKGQRIDEWLFGVEYEVAPNLSVGVKAARRQLGQVIEDFLIPSEGNYFIANPGTGIGSEMAFYSGDTVPAPKARRENTSVEISGRKRYSDNWQFLASYVWSRLEGNYDGLFQNSTGQLDPNINSAFDYADFLVNADGRLTNDRVHQIKLDGTYDVPRGPLEGLNLGLSTRWLSGLPLNAYGYSFLYANWEYYLAPRGSLGRGPSDWEADIQVGYPIRLGGNNRLNIVLDIFNVFDRQEPVQLDERYNLAEHAECGGIPAAVCNHDNGFATQPGTLTPLGQLSNPLSTAPNPDYQRKGIGFTLPRSIRLGARLTW